MTTSDEDWLDRIHGVDLHDEMAKIQATTDILKALHAAASIRMEDVAFLPDDELIEAMEADNSKDLCVAASPSPSRDALVLCMGDLRVVTTPFDFSQNDGKIAVIDHGQTIRIGITYEIAVDSVLHYLGKP